MASLTACRRWSTVLRRGSRHNPPGSKSTGEPAVEDVAADPAAFFSAEQQRAMDAARPREHPHQRADRGREEHAHQRCVQGAARRGGHRQAGDEARPAHEVPGVPVTIFDTPGIELGQAKNDVIREYRKTITDSRKGRRTT